MRLIDADAVKKLLTDRYEGFEYIEKDIDRIPTAYDVDKVIEQLEEYKRIMKSNWQENGKMFDEKGIDYYRGRYNSAIDILEIVKRGGKND